MDLKKVRDHAEADAVPDIADGAAEDEGERNHGGREASSVAQDDEKDNSPRDQREGRQNPVGQRGPRRVHEQGERRSGIAHVSEPEHMADDDDRVAFLDVGDDPVLGEAVEQDDDGGDCE